MPIIVFGTSSLAAPVYLSRTISLRFASASLQDSNAIQYAARLGDESCTFLVRVGEVRCLAGFFCAPPTRHRMRSWFAVLMAVTCVTACALRGDDVTTTNVTGWTGRDIEELIQVAGPYAQSRIRGDSRTYTWLRASCRMDARTSLDNKITTVEMIGTSQGCSPYLPKLGAG